MTRRIGFAAVASGRLGRRAAVLAVSAALSFAIVALAQRGEDSHKSPAAGAQAPPATGSSPASSPAVTGFGEAWAQVSSDRVKPGGSVTVSGSGFLPGETVRVELFSGGGLTSFGGPYLLGDSPADDGGTLPPIAVTVPEEVGCAGATVQMRVTGRASHRPGTRILTLR